MVERTNVSSADDHLAWLEAARDGGAPTDATEALRDTAMDLARVSRKEGNTNHQMFHQLVAGQMLTTLQIAGLREDVQALSERIAALEGACPGLEPG